MQHQIQLSYNLLSINHSRITFLLQINLNIFYTQSIYTYVDKRFPITVFMRNQCGK